MEDQPHWIQEQEQTVEMKMRQYARYTRCKTDTCPVELLLLLGGPGQEREVAAAEGAA